MRDCTVAENKENISYRKREEKKEKRKKSVGGKINNKNMKSQRKCEHAKEA